MMETEVARLYDMDMSTIVFDSGTCNGAHGCHAARQVVCTVLQWSVAVHLRHVWINKTRHECQWVVNTMIQLHICLWLGQHVAFYLVICRECSCVRLAHLSYLPLMYAFVLPVASHKA